MSANAMITLGDQPGTPVKLHSANPSEPKGPFVSVHTDCGGRVEQKWRCTTDGQVFEKDKVARAYLFDDGLEVPFTPSELAALKAPRSGEIELRAFHPRGTVDRLHRERAYYVMVGDDGLSGYHALVRCLRAQRLEAVGVYYTRGGQQAVVLEPHDEAGLQLWTLQAVDPVPQLDDPRAYVDDVPDPDVLAKLTAEIEKRRSQRFDLDEYRDDFAGRARLKAEEKAGRRPVAPSAGRVTEIEDAIGKQKRTPRAARARASRGHDAQRVVPLPVRVPTSPTQAERDESPSSSEMKTSG